MRTFAAVGLAIYTLLLQTAAGRSADAQAVPSRVLAGTQPLNVPQANACQSMYDSFYENEPGVYAYWPLCEARVEELGLDYLGAWPLAHGFTKGDGIRGGVVGPVDDNETAAQTLDASSKLEQQGIFLNKHAGTLAMWLNASATNYPVAAESMSAIGGKSRVAIEALQRSGRTGICFRGTLDITNGDSFHAEDCVFRSDTWYRVVLTWNGTKLALYVNGAPRASAAYDGLLDDAVYYYQLFPGCCNTGKQMSIAKALISNRAWTTAEVADDFKPVLSSPPSGGILVLSQKLGTIHKDVLGYIDNNQDLSPAPLAALKDGLKAIGVMALRYTGGGFADADDWHASGVDCTAIPGATNPARTRQTTNRLDHYLEAVANPLNLDVDLTVNYGSNPPDCNQGGNPDRNGSDLVNFVNREKNYAIKRWEIGNEQYAYGGPNIDLHPNPYFRTQGHGPSTYTQYEPAFYKAMKSADPGIQIAVPSAGPNPGYDTLVQYQLPLLKQAMFDALVLHSYPLIDPITDGTTLYPDRVAAGTQIRGTLLSLQTQLLNAGKPANAIWVTEWNAEVEGNRWSKQSVGAVMPLFAATQIAEYMQAGVEFASWQAQGETDVCSTYNYDPHGESAYSWWDGCGDTALVYTGRIPNVGEAQVGLKPGDLTPVSRGFQILSQSGFVSEGESMLRVEIDRTGAPWLAAYAATHRGRYAVLLINRDRDSAHKIPVKFVDTIEGARIDMWSYGKEQYDRSRDGDWEEGPVTHHFEASHDTSEVVIPPWSVNVLVFT
jgi:Concanavalin A-like lectin/glucanases superfamily